MDASNTYFNGWCLLLFWVTKSLFFTIEQLPGSHTYFSIVLFFISSQGTSNILQDKSFQEVHIYKVSLSFLVISGLLCKKLYPCNSVMDDPGTDSFTDKIFGDKIHDPNIWYQTLNTIHTRLLLVAHWKQGVEQLYIFFLQ